MRKIGCHLSISGGYTAMCREALSLGGDTAQVFSRNPRGGKARAEDPADNESYRALCGETGFGQLLVHAPYTLNPCSATPSTRDFAKMAMEDDLLRLRNVETCGYNFHPGSHTGQGVETGISQIAELLNAVLYPEQNTLVLLETMAGKGSEVGGRFEELREIIDRVTLSDKIGVCLDTCHIFDGGYDIVNRPEEVLAEFDRVVGLGRLKAIHCNDSKNELGSHKDRHAKIGEGNIGAEALVRFLRLEPLRQLPVFLETPNDNPGYAKEIALLRERLAD